MYRKKPIEVEARQIDAMDYDDMTDLVGWCGGTAIDHGRYVIAIPTLEGVMYAEPGDWIIEGVKGEFYPCKPDIFAATYEKVTVDP
jgi:hypothetical protein